jgi:flavodoxin
MNVLIAYYSRTGYTRQAADAIAAAARKMGHEVVVKRVAEVQEGDVQAADALFVGTWVAGLILFGVRPAGVNEWVPALPSLTGKPVAVFCTYAFHPRGSLRTLAGLLEKRGANIRGQQAFHRRRTSQGAEEFVRGVLGAAGG